MKKAITFCGLWAMAMFSYGQGFEKQLSITFTPTHSIVMTESGMVMQNETDTIPTFTTATTEIGAGNGVEVERNGDYITITWAAYYCIPFSRHTAWESSFEGDTACTHAWVYAEEQDVNNINGLHISTDLYCPCGCSTATSEARICEKCYRGEFMVRFDGFDMVMREESAYSKLRRKAPKN